MNKLLKYGLPGLLAIGLAAPAMAQNGYTGNDIGQNGQQWNNGYAGQWHRRYGRNGEAGWRNSNEAYKGYRNYDETGSNGAAVTPRFVAHLQHRLQQQGFYHQGNVDGAWGPETQSALENFQQRNGLRPTGQIDMRTLQALNMLNGGDSGRSGGNGPNNGQNDQSYNQHNQTDGMNGWHSQNGSQGSSGYDRNAWNAGQNGMNNNQKFGQNTDRNGDSNQGPHARNGNGGSTNGTSGNNGINGNR